METFGYVINVRNKRGLKTREVFMMTKCEWHSVENVKNWISKGVLNCPYCNEIFAEKDVVIHHLSRPDSYYIKYKMRMDEQNKLTPLDGKCLTHDYTPGTVYNWWKHLEILGQHRQFLGKILRGNRTGEDRILEHLTIE